MTEAVALVAMYRDPSEFPKPHSASVHPAEVGSMKAAGWRDGEPPAAASPAPEPVQEPLQPASEAEAMAEQETPALEQPLQSRELAAVHRGGGSWSVMDGETELVERLSTVEAKAFNAMADSAEKEAYVAKALAEKEA